MSVQRYDFVNGIGYSSDESRVEDPLGGYVLHSDYAALEARCTKTEDELERERVRLAACGVAAMGYEDKGPLDPGSYGYSASYDDVLRFRKQLIAERDALQAKLTAVEEALRELVEVATLRGDNDLPHPSDDPLPWTGRMQDAWIDARAALADTTTGEVQP